MSNNQSLLEWGVAIQALAGHAESGDAYVVEPFTNGVLVGVIDGLGHGDRAAAVATTAAATLKTHPHEPVTSLMERCHEKLRGSRGAVISLASFNPLKETMTWLGVGNVDGILLKADKQSGSAHKTLLLRGGVVGYRLPSLYDVVLPIARGDLLFFVTDGIRSGFIKEQFQNPYSQTLDKTQSVQQIADTILAQYGRGTDDALVLVARYNGPDPANLSRA
ncbi:MAG: SpoIIE family protein phosphatase [Anaerolineae bacterium]|nr:SpoIIE family protein phosphatase [Anaerolineae bacterium]